MAGQPRQNQPAQSGQTQPQGRKSIGAVIREELEIAVRQRVRGSFEGAPVARVTAVTVTGLIEAVKNGDLEKAIDVAIAGGVTISYLQKLIADHPDLFKTPAARATSWLEGIIDVLAPGILPTADDPRVVALEERLRRRRS